MKTKLMREKPDMTPLFEEMPLEKGKVYTLRLRTYDNSVDADKGFYVNKNQSEKPSNYVNRRVK